MKILEFCLSPDFGGLELYMRDFSRWLDERREISLYLGLRRNSRLAKDLEILVRPTLFFKDPLPWLPWSQARQLARFIEANQIDVVHVHWKDDLFVAALAKKLSKRKFAFIHTRQMMVPGKKRDPYHWFIYRTMDRFIAITKQIEQQARDNLGLPPDKLDQIYYGVRPAQKLSAEEAGAARQKYGIPSEFTVGLVGRIDWYKAQYLLVEAMAILQHKGIEIYAVIVGHAMNEDYLEKLKQQAAEAGVADRMRFIGFTDKPHEVMQCFDTLILTTHVETFGLVLVEAMALAIPVIGSNAGGVLEIIDHEKTGLLFKTKDARSLADAIERMVNDPGLRQRLAMAGREKAREAYDTETQNGKVLSLMFGTAGIKM